MLVDLPGNEFLSHYSLVGGVMACLLSAIGIANAQLRGQSQLSCAFYNRLEQQCNCNGTDGYFIAYGLRYCERFLKSTGWTPAGTKWRDQTLICLQQSLSPALPQGPSAACDCQNARNIAWQTHVRCYTEASASVCRLPLSDLLKIYSIIDAPDLLSPYGFSQVLAIAKTCLREQR